MLDVIQKITDIRKQTTELIEVLTKHLRAGWSTWVNVDDNRGYTALSDALDKYEAYVECDKKKKKETTTA